jgi:hypothetical protein
MSGFFVVRRRCLKQVLNHLHGTGFKLLVDLLVCSPPSTRIKRSPTIFAVDSGVEASLVRASRSSISALSCTTWPYKRLSVTGGPADVHCYCKLQLWRHCCILDLREFA